MLVRNFKKFYYNIEDGFKKDNSGKDKVNFILMNFVLNMENCIIR